MKLFSNKITPACRYCKLGKKSSHGEMVLCSKTGIMAPADSCRSFRYAPLKRVPKRTPLLPKFSKKDFTL